MGYILICSYKSPVMYSSSIISSVWPDIHMHIVIYQLIATATIIFSKQKVRLLSEVNYGI